MIQDAIHKQIVRHIDKVENWFCEVRKQIDLPFYSSYDIRDSGFKVVNVDANIFPAGFNNICGTDREHCGALVRTYLDRHYSGKGLDVKRILLLTEEHTNNAYYWDNVSALRSLIEDSGVKVEIGIPRAQPVEGLTMKSMSFGDVPVHAAVFQNGELTVTGFKPDLVISNNDFSEYYEEWGTELKSVINPPRELGWYQRKKSSYFKHYNQLCEEFARLIEVDPWLLTVETELFLDFDMADEKSKAALAARVDAMIARTAQKYTEQGIKDKPVVFVKNNSGTYGLAVMRVESGAEILALNNKTRKKMQAAKGGRDVQEVIIQEGVPSIVVAEGITAEPTIYLLGCQLAGGFLRSHSEKGPTESLNSPGAVYKRLCVSDLKVSVEGHPMENVYGWIAKLGALAIGRESAEMNIRYKNYRRLCEDVGTNPASV